MFSIPTKGPKRTVVLPTSIFVRRTEPKRDRYYDGETGSDRVPIIIQPETAPKPIDDTSFYGVGRDPTHAWSHSWVWNGGLHLNEWLSVLRWEAAGDALIPKIPSAKVVGMPRGQHIPATERTNIDPPESTSYGSLATLRPSPSFSPVYRKLM
jgi:hypothetical protein